MIELALGLFLFVLAWLALQFVAAVIGFVFTSISDSYYSARRWSKQAEKQKSEQPEQTP